MKRIAILLCLALVATMAFAGGDMAKDKPMGKHHKMTVEVVSMDMDAKTLTIKDEKGENKTVPVLGEALESLKNLKPGEKVLITCEDNEKGEHQGISKIEMAKAHHTAAPAK